MAGAPDETPRHSISARSEQPQWNKQAKTSPNRIQRSQNNMCIVYAASEGNYAKAHRLNPSMQINNEDPSTNNELHKQSPSRPPTVQRTPNDTHRATAQRSPQSPQQTAKTDCAIKKLDAGALSEQSPAWHGSVQIQSRTCRGRLRIVFAEIARWGYELEISAWPRPRDLQYACKARTSSHTPELRRAAIMGDPRRSKSSGGASPKYMNTETQKRDYYTIRW